MIICRRLRMIKRIVSSDNCSMHCQANKNAGIMRDLCALQAGDYEDRRDYVYRQGIIFDVDGTLWDSTPIVAEAWTQAVLECGIKDLHRNSGGIKTVIWKDHVRDRSIPFSGGFKRSAGNHSGKMLRL